MGRPKLKAEAVRKIMSDLIGATHTLILRDGLERITIRKIAAAAGLNSASIYKYFQDLDQLLLFGCIDILKSYTEDLSNSIERCNTQRDVYFMTWQLFCSYGFLYPQCVNHLFFSKHSKDLGAVVEEYYDLFPERLAGMSDQLQLMLRASDLPARNLEVLRPLLEERVSPERLRLINELTVAYFHMLLQDCIEQGQMPDIEGQTQRMLAACEYLLQTPV